MELDKAPSPDGFPTSFFHNNQDTMGKDVWLAIKEFFKRCKLIKQWNNTFLTLIPKNIEGKDFKDYRPISLCNVSYKLITKILAKTLKNIIPTIISLVQDGFVPRR